LNRKLSLNDFYNKLKNNKNEYTSQHIGHSIGLDNFFTNLLFKQNRVELQQKISKKL
jgi:hypothetical protein